MLCNSLLSTSNFLKEGAVRIGTKWSEPTVNETEWIALPGRMDRGGISLEMTT